MEPAGLVRALNQAIGIAAHDTESSNTAPLPGSSPAESAGSVEAPQPGPVEIEVDARPIIRAGQEPFSVIMAAARDVSPGHSFRLMSTFEPLPLYDVLGARGFGHSARQLGEEDWEILFFKGADSPQPIPTSRPVEPVTDTPALDWDAPNATITIDVRDLVPPEPMIRILEALEELAPGQTLLVYHVRRPVHLYPRLDELGCSHETRDLGPGRIALLIRKPGEQAGVQR
jgi:uncharacterized protein (DUF2249 family)